MLKIRLSRVGKHKAPSYRVVVADARSTRDGAYVDILGRYDPLSTPKLVEIDGEKARSWLDKGAQPTDVVVRLLKGKGIEPRATKTKTAAS